MRDAQRIARLALCLRATQLLVLCMHSRADCAKSYRTNTLEQRLAKPRGVSPDLLQHGGWQLAAS